MLYDGWITQWLGAFLVTTDQHSLQHGAASATAVANGGPACAGVEYEIDPPARLDRLQPGFLSAQPERAGSDLGSSAQRAASRLAALVNPHLAVCHGPKICPSEQLSD